MIMSDSEILSSYSSAKQKNKQLRILSELNDCSISKIIEILRAGGITDNELPKSRKAFIKPKEVVKVIEVRPVGDENIELPASDTVDLPDAVYEALTTEFKRLQTVDQSMQEQLVSIRESKAEILNFLRMFTRGK